MEWKDFFNSIKNKEYSLKLNTFLDNEYLTKTIYPPRKLIFNAFNLTNFEDIKVVIIGQDPYHEKGEAMGLAFSVPKGITLPPSLRNIYKEIGKEFNVSIDDKSGDLTYLAKQGVFLINPVLTVEEHKANSHKNAEYDAFFKDLLRFIDENNNPIVFMLWGNEAKKYKSFINNKNRLILETSHPSPLSANQGGWFNTSIFVKCNQYLKNNNLKEINFIPVDFNNNLNL